VEGAAAGCAALAGATALGARDAQHGVGLCVVRDPTAYPAATQSTVLAAQSTTSARDDAFMVTRS
jgi:hypothetical protein